MRNRHRSLLVVLTCVAGALGVMGLLDHSQRIPFEAYWAFASAGLAVGLLIDMWLSALAPQLHADEAFKLRFSIRDMLWLMALVALGLAWSNDHWRLRQERDSATTEARESAEQAQRATQQIEFLQGMRPTISRPARVPRRSDF